MTGHLAALPLWAAVAAAALILLGAGLTLLGAIGLARLSNFYDRIHAPTLGTSWGTAAIVLGAIIVFSAVQGALVIHAVVIGAFVMITTPVTLLVLGRAALQRDRAEGGEVPMPTALRPDPGPVSQEEEDAVEAGHAP